MNNITYSNSLVKKVEDITHTPKRTQAGNIQQAIDNGDISVHDTNLEVINDLEIESIPKLVTIESAIKYYAKTAVGDRRELHLKTAVWLRRLLKLLNENKSNVEVPK